MNPVVAAKFYTIQDVMSLLGVCDETVYRWIKSGKLKAVKLGGGSLWRVSAEALSEFLAKGEGSAAQTLVSR